MICIVVVNKDRHVFFSKCMRDRSVSIASLKVNCVNLLQIGSIRNTDDEIHLCGFFFHYNVSLFLYPDLIQVKSIVHRGRRWV